jgi:glucokinase
MIRLGRTAGSEVTEAMHRHLFVDDDPPPVMPAEPGNSGARGGALPAARRASDVS